MAKQLSSVEADRLEEIGKAIGEGIISAIGKWVIIAVIFFTILNAVASHFDWNKDATDQPNGGKLSGMSLVTDYGTGCQYLAKNGALMPRLDKAGRHICN